VPRVRAGRLRSASESPSAARAARCLFIPRIRDLPSKRLHVFDPGAVPKELRGLIGSKIRTASITANWPDVLRSAATMAAGTIAPSQLLRKFAAYSR